MTTSDPLYTISGERVSLGPMRRDLVPSYTRWLNDFALQRTLGGPPMPRTIEQELDRYTQLSADPASTQFTIYVLATGQPIGITELQAIDWRARSATFVIFIGEATARGQGHGTETTRLVCEYGFSTLGLHSIGLAVVAPNIAGIRAYERAGFRQIGRRRACRPIDGQLHDDIHMECLASEFAHAREGPVVASVG